MATVVIDGANVATIETSVIQISRLVASIQYFEKIVPHCIAFVPQYWLSIKPSATGNDLMQTGNWEKLQELVEKEKVIATPSHAHDDHFIIGYAMRHDGFILSNDMFRDHVKSGLTFEGKKLTRKWTDKHCINYTFVKDEFLPNVSALEQVTMYRKPANDSRIFFDELQNESYGTNKLIEVPTNSVSLAYLQSEMVDCSTVSSHSDHSQDYSPKKERLKIEQALCSKSCDLSETGLINVHPNYIQLLTKRTHHIEQKSGAHLSFSNKTNICDNITVAIYGSAKCIEKAKCMIKSLLQQKLHLDEKSTESMDIENW